MKLPGTAGRLLAIIALWVALTVCLGVVLCGGACAVIGYRLSDL